MKMILLPLSYLCGSLPSAFLVVKIFYGRNIYTLGSGNGGATNVLRNFGKKPAALVFTLDFLKGFLPLLLVPLLLEDIDRLTLLLMTTGVLAGHAFPLWTGFKGGKGMAVTAGAIGALSPGAIPFCLGAFIVTARFTRYASLASLCAALTLPAYYLIRHLASPVDEFLLTESFFLFLAALIIILHRKNIARLLAGTEPQLKEKVRHDKGVSAPEDGD